MANRDFIACAHCSKSFQQDGRTRTFCSRGCYLESKALKPKKCKQCGKEFIKPNNQKASVFCSSECVLASKRVSPHICESCGTLFTPLKYRKHERVFRAYTGRKNCSAECAFAAKGAVTKRRMAETRDRWVGANNPMWTGALLRANSSYRGPEWRAISDRARKRDGNACKECGMSQPEHLAKWKKKLEVHHIVPFYEFASHAKANRLSNLITLCKTCHMTAERKIENRQISLDLGPEPRKKKPDGMFKGSRNPRAILDETKVAAIKRLLRSGRKQADVASTFGVQRSVISKISAGTSWRHVP